MNHIRRMISLLPLPLMSIGLMSLLVVASSTHAATIQGFGTLKFGMAPAEVAALEGCSSQTECLYDILGKNRYFTLGYGPVQDAPDPADTAVPSETTQETLSLIDIEMGTYTQEWFSELFEVLASQYSVTHYPTEDEKTVFQQGTSQELVIGLADGFVLLKLMRRPFGNVIIRVIYQDADHAQAQRQAWVAALTP